VCGRDLDVLGKGMVEVVEKDGVAFWGELFSRKTDTKQFNVLGYKMSSTGTRKEHTIKTYPQGGKYNNNKSRSTLMKHGQTNRILE